MTDATPVPRTDLLTAADRAKLAETRHLEHLKMIQAVILRLAGNSFQMKGWAISLVSALGAVAGWQNRQYGPMWAAYAATLAFSYLDTWFLQRERMYRKHFAAVVKAGAGIGSTRGDFDMDASGYEADVPWWKVYFSATIAPLYLALSLGTGVIAWRWTLLRCQGAHGDVCGVGEVGWAGLLLLILAIPFLLHRVVSALLRMPPRVVGTANREGDPPSEPDSPEDEHEHPPPAHGKKRRRRRGLPG